jgi:hypothetical protein
MECNPPDVEIAKTLYSALSGTDTDAQLPWATLCRLLAAKGFAADAVAAVKAGLRVGLEMDGDVAEAYLKGLCDTQQLVSGARRRERGLGRSCGGEVSLAMMFAWLKKQGACRGPKFSRPIEVGLLLGSVVMTSVKKTCSNSWLLCRQDASLTFLETMAPKYGIKPEARHVTYVVAGLAGAGNFDDASSLIDAAGNRSWGRNACESLRCKHTVSIAHGGAGPGRIKALT